MAGIGHFNNQRCSFDYKKVRTTQITQIKISMPRNFIFDLVLPIWLVYKIMMLYLYSWGSGIFILSLRLTMGSQKR